jgi:hypothetical protein
MTAQPEIASGLEVNAKAATGAGVDGAETGPGPFVWASRTFARHRIKERGQIFFITKMIMNLSFCTQAKLSQCSRI